ILRDGRPVVLLRMKGSVLADRVAQQQIPDRTDRQIELRVALGKCGGPWLIVGPDRLVEMPQEDIGTEFANPSLGLLARVRLLPEERRIVAIAGHLPGAKDQADRLVARIGRPGKVPPRVRGVAGMNAGRIAVDAADRLVRLRPRAAVVAEQEL